MEFQVVQGFFHEDFSAVAKFLEKQLTQDGQGGASICVYHRGEKVVDIWGGSANNEGKPWQKDTMAISFSTTKGVLTTAMHMLVDKGLCSFDDPVSSYWPEFGCNGKDKITIRDLLSHRTGLYPISSLVSNIYELLDWEHMCELIAKSKPAIKPGKKPGYQAITYGWLVGELIRRITDKPVEQFVQDEIAKPLDLDGFYLLTPETEYERIADLISPLPKRDTTKTTPKKRRLLRLPKATKEALAPKGIAKLVGDRRLLDSPIPSFNGVFTARSLAKLYAALACGGVIDGHRILSNCAIEMASQVQTARFDHVLKIPMFWRMGYHTITTSRGFPRRAFGHFGYGGSGAWADPKRQLAVAMTLNKIAGSPVGDSRMVRLGGTVLKSAKRHNKRLRRIDRNSIQAPPLRAVPKSKTKLRLIPKKTSSHESQSNSSSQKPPPAKSA